MTTANPDRSGTPAAGPDRYLERIGLDPDDTDFDAEGAGTPDRETLARLQRAHVTEVPFETFAITGDPFGPCEGQGVSLALSDLYEKIVERQRGGYCFELNGLFGWLLGEVGFDADRISARVVSGGGEPTTPAGHHAHLVRLDRPYVVDVGFGPPIPRRPIPLDGTVVRDQAGIEWRVVESERPDADYKTQSRAPDVERISETTTEETPQPTAEETRTAQPTAKETRTTTEETGTTAEETGTTAEETGTTAEENPGPTATEWGDRYVLDTTPRSLDYFEATCEYFATAPESPFTGDPVAVIATDEGHLKLKPDTLTRYERGEETERPVVGDGTEREVGESEWHHLLTSEFGLRFRAERD